MVEQAPITYKRLNECKYRFFERLSGNVAFTVLMDDHLTVDPAQVYTSCICLLEPASQDMIMMYQNIKQEMK